MKYFTNIKISFEIHFHILYNTCEIFYSSKDHIIICVDADNLSTENNIEILGNSK